MADDRHRANEKVDCIIEQAGELLAIEVKVAHGVWQKDFGHACDFQQALPTFKRGIFPHQDQEVVPFGENLAIPLSVLCSH